MEKTISKSVSCRGIGLHSGKNIHLNLRPAKPGNGVVFVRTDLGRTMIPANQAHVISSQFSTIIGTKGASIQTVEHLLAAVTALEIDNLVVELDGPEVPAMDGSASPFIALLLKAGTTVQAKARPFIEILKPIHISEKGKSITIRPGSSFEVSYRIEFNHSVVSKQAYHYWHSPQAFIREIAPARTFAFLKDVSYLQSQGFAMGGSLDNAVVVGDDAVLNKQGLRFSDEFVRHKILDLVGDFALLGRPVLGKIEALCSGHQMHVALVKEIYKNKKAWRMVSASSTLESAQKHYPGPRFQHLPIPA